MKELWVFIEINPAGGVPIYLQIVSQVKYAVAAGALHPNDQLPTVRDLAAQLRVNPNTVARAYRELRREKVITARVGGGSFVSGQGVDIGRKERVRIVSALLDDALVQAFHLKVEPEDVRKILEARLKKLEIRTEERTRS